MKKLLKMLGIGFIALVVLVLAIGACSSKEVTESKPVDKPKTEVVEKPKAKPIQPKVDQSELFINDSLAQFEIINAKMGDFGDEMLLIGSNPELLNDAETMAAFNAQVDDLKRIVNVELAQPGNRDGEEMAKIMFNEYKTEYNVFLDKVKKGVNEQNAELIMESNEHQMAALSSFEAAVNAINIAIENRAGK